MPGQERDGTRLQGLLDLALSLERLTGYRRLLTAAVSVLAVPIWVLAIWPQALPAEDRRFLLMGFGVVLLLAVASLAREWRAGRALDRRVAENPGLVRRAPALEGPGGGGDDE